MSGEGENQPSEGAEPITIRVRDQVGSVVIVSQREKRVSRFLILHETQFK